MEILYVQKYIYSIKTCALISNQQNIFLGV